MVFYAKAERIGAGVVADPVLLSGFREMLAARGGGPHVPIAHLADYLRNEQHLGRLDAGADADAMAALLLGACHHRAHLANFVDLPGTDEEFAASIVGALLRR